jgi:hypothetical protein
VNANLLSILCAVILSDVHLQSQSTACGVVAIHVCRVFHEKPAEGANPQEIGKHMLGRNQNGIFGIIHIVSKYYIKPSGMVM